MSTNASDTPARPRLTELCSEPLAFALSLRTAKAPGDAERLFQDIAAMFERFGQKARQAGVDSAHQEAARYALCALLDEIVLGSRWDIKTQWMSKPLQMSMFGDFTAGEQFYRRLDALRADAAHNVDALEVYAQCLALGFRGKYADLAGMQKVDELLAELQKDIRGVRGIDGARLSRPAASASAAPTEARKLPVWVVAAACAGLLVVLLLVLDGLLASQAESFFSEAAGDAAGGGR